MKIVKKNENYLVEFSDESEKNLIDSYLSNYLEVKKINDDVLCFVNKRIDLYQKDVTKKKIVLLLNDKNISVKDKVEGVFENFLNSKDLKIFKEMIDNKEIIKFKLSSSYKKSIYEPNPKIFPPKNEVNSNLNKDFNKNKPFKTEKNNSNKAGESEKNKDSNFELVTSEFEKNGFVIIGSNLDASKFSSKYEQEIKNNEIFGIKSFDQRYYVIKKELFDEYKEKILGSGLKQDFLIEDLQKSLEVNIDALMIVLELLKEEALVIEKRKGIYRLI